MRINDDTNNSLTKYKMETITVKQVNLAGNLMLWILRAQIGDYIVAKL